MRAELAMGSSTPATNGQPLTAPINFTTEAAKLTNVTRRCSPTARGADQLEQANRRCWPQPSVAKSSIDNGG